MKVMISHPTGNHNVRAVVSCFSKVNMLAEFNTTIAISSDFFLLKFLPLRVQNEILRRSFPVPSKNIKQYCIRELARLVFTKLGFSNLINNQTAWANIDAVYLNFDKMVARRLSMLNDKQNINAVYAYEDGAFMTFNQAKKIGLKTIYDLPIAFWETGRNLMQREAERLPKWSTTLGGGIMDSQRKLERKTRELEMADMVICPSQFVIDSLPLWAKNKKLLMVPFGSPKSFCLHDLLPKNITTLEKRPLRVLFCGSMGQRKGLSDLFEAIRLLKSPQIELVVMGSPLSSMEFYKSELPNFTYEHCRPHEEVLNLMRSCDVFCLPSIVEGRALVMQEAMSQGLPLIITPNTGGADLIIEGRTGFLVPIQAPHAIAEKLSWFLDNRSLIPEMGKMAQEHAAKYSWNDYGIKIAESVSVLL